jgi:hypothetical protein
VLVSDSWYDHIYLEDEQRELLSWMVEGERSLPAAKRDAFLLIGAMGGSFLIHPDLKERREVAKGDLETLADSGLLRRDFGSKGTPNYQITPQGRRYYAEMKRRAGEAAEVVEKEVRLYLDADAFRTSYQGAYDRWRQAQEELWGAENEAQFTKVGHICREAMQAFASELAERVRITGVPADPARTVDRIRAVVDKTAEGRGEKYQAFLSALLPYWGTVSDLVQRQEHGAQKEGEPLTWEDARRVVFQTAIVMFEIARAVG